MQTKHTPGPWEVELDVVRDGDINVFAPDLHPIAMIDCREHPDDDDDPPREVALANAYLISAAPELLTVLKAAIEHLEYCGYGDRWEREISRDLPALLNAAVAKAEGR